MTPLKVFYSEAEQAYHPRHSFFCGEFTAYPEVPGRTRAIVTALTEEDGFSMASPQPVAPEMLEGVHDPAYLDTLREVCGRLKPEEEFFPFHMQALPLLRNSPYPRIRMGFYALDGSTPLIAESYRAAIGAAETTLAGAMEVAEGARMVYALPRPPGHHAGRRNFGGYCLINNAAVAAEVLLKLGKVAILDVDYHHGNGTQDIFWSRDDVYYASVHCTPEEAYPYIAGSAGEIGEGKGRGHNLNLPLPGGTDWAAYQPVLEKALESIRSFAPSTLIVSLGFDTLKSDPIGTFALEMEDYASLARAIGQLDLPMLILQEGGYHVNALGFCALHFFRGMGMGGGATGRSFNCTNEGA